MKIAETADMQNLNQVLDNDSFEYVYFWGHQPSVDGSLTKTCLSQWFQRAFVVDDVTYISAEHYFMAQKAKLFGDSIAFDKIIETKYPEDAKKIGRQVIGFCSKIWDKHKFDIAVKSNAEKFGQHEDLKKFLIDTNQAILVEASPVDKIWGVGLAQDNPDIQNVAKWQGLNLLGFALMQVREMLVSHHP